MKNYWIQYRPFLLFLGKFALTYLLLASMYQLYLNQFDVKTNEVDGFTQSVAQQCKQVLLFFDDSHTELHPTQPSVKLFYREKFVARIIEGCNALSVIILFIAFVVAFTGKWKSTILFILGGSLLLHVLNIIRIALLAIALYYYPEWEPILHGVIFPLFIYSVVFMLWVIWVNKFSLYAKKTTAS
ncbi:exosortase family protein XrtF [Flavobacterium sp. GT3R68]|uniref:exosortase family protein XrtF n=1 Tax=Flavobacterium sp. GT3R68 TaxID=2594437 RepID=UPI000F88B904|nr:exosortase family protein XrtF [Flavobacterium sp. GT3R68]RTY90927.1 exosortase family protein XrtF [Flavobacterium sp. GSN2]TRW90490.1 exosortase family protein XrtF [Flavobacterium sp. GT3R68]